jgi:hypothetical protein
VGGDRDVNIDDIGVNPRDIDLRVPEIVVVGT